MVLDPSHSRLQAGLQLVPFTCLVLALNSARPREANINRLTQVAFPQPGPPPVPAQVPPQVVPTPGPVIEELDSDGDSEPEYIWV